MIRPAGRYNHRPMSGAGPDDRWLTQRLRNQAEDIRRLTDGLSEEQLGRRTVPEKWSVKEVVCHLWRMQQVFADRIEAMASQDQPAFASYDPDRDADFPGFVSRPARETLDAFARERERLVARLESLPASSWQRQGRHPDFPRYDLRFAVENMAYHEGHHIYQIFQRRSLLEA